jgi:antitoxin ParD1/3/4
MQRAQSRRDKQGKIMSLDIGNYCQLCNNDRMPTQNVNLSDKQADFIRQRVKGGNFRNASEVVRAGLRLLEQQERENKLKLRALRKLATEGFEQLDRGEYEEIGDVANFMKKIDVKVRARKQ